MVFIKSSSAKEYPNFDIYLQYFVQAMDEPRVWEAFKKWSCLDESSAIKCVSYNTYPEIVVPNKDKVLTAGVHSYGHFKPSLPNQINVNKVSELIAIDSGKTSSAKLYQTEKYLQKLILHELVHWGRYWSMEDDEYVDKATLTDTGDAFEIDAYSNPDMPWL